MQDAAQTTEVTMRAMLQLNSHGSSLMYNQPVKRWGGRRARRWLNGIAHEKIERCPVPTWTKVCREHH